MRVVSGMAETMRTEPDEDDKDDEDKRDWQLLLNLLSQGLRHEARELKRLD